MGNAKKDFRKYAELESKQEQIIVDITNQLNSANLKLSEFRRLKRDAGLHYYTKEMRQKIFEQAQKQGYSHEDIARMEQYLDDSHWNQDEVDVEGGILEIFQNAEEFLSNSMSFTLKLQSLLSSIGKIIDDNGGEQNDN